MSQIKKWGFGMAPLKPSTAQSNNNSILAVMNLVKGEGIANPKSINEDISRVKGIFNRVIKQDQWDWFTINMHLDYPTNRDLSGIVSSLTLLRKAITNKDDILGQDALKRLLHFNFLTYCDNYLSFSLNSKTDSEYLYILSRREEREILKIGMTTRNVKKRVDEINSATGVLYPYSPRKVYKVKNSKLVEKEVHSLLSKYRIREDREFFCISYKTACKLIEEYLEQHHLYYYG